jgi:hypothetical protein
MTQIDPKNTKAILIGASEFDFANDNFQNLPNVKNNLVELNRLLIEVVGIEKNHIHPIENKNYYDEIKLEIIDLIPNASDTIILYYAGHGIPNPSDFYLATKKTRRKEPEYSSGIPSKHLVNLVIKKAKAKNIIFIIDCCYSIRATEGIIHRGKQVFFITAASSNQAAKDESPENPDYTAFTHELLVILEQGIENAGKILTLQDIFTGLKARLVNQNLPVPQITSYGSPNELGICKNRAYASQNSLKAKPFPETLCYLPDRQGQKDELKRTIQKLYANEKRLLLCLIHGDENEYSHFIEECLLKDFLRNDVSLSKYFYNPVKFKEIRLSLETTHTIDELHQQILMRLVDTIDVEPEKEAIAKEFARWNQPIVIYTHIKTTYLENWKEDKQKIIDGFLEFWGNWPKLITQRHPFLVFLSFIYEKEESQTFSLSGIKNLFRYKKRQAINLTVQDRIQELGEKCVTLKDSFKHKGIYAVVLPQLESVNWISIENWLENYKEQITGHHDIRALEHKIKSILDKKKNTVPMNRLVKELKQILIYSNE